MPAKKRGRVAVSLNRLDRHNLPTDELQEFATQLLHALYTRAEEDYCLTTEGGGSEESVAADNNRRKALRQVYELLTVIPPRGEKWRHKKG